MQRFPIPLSARKLASQQQYPSCFSAPFPSNLTLTRLVQKEESLKGHLLTGFCEPSSSVLEMKWLEMPQIK